MFGTTALLPALPVILALAPPASTGVITESAKLIAQDSQAGDWFGFSVASTATHAIVGAPHDSDQANNAGSVYVFDVGTGAQLAELYAANGKAGDLFGTSVSISGTLAVIGAPGDDPLGTNSGSAYVFDLLTGTQLAHLVPADGAAGDRFGHSVAISGMTVIAGARNHDDSGVASGAAYLFDASSGTQLRELVPADGVAGDQFGWSVAIRAQDALVGALDSDDLGLDSGSAYLFDVASGALVRKLLAGNGSLNDHFGCSVALSDTRALVGAYGTSFPVGGPSANGGTAYLFDLSSGDQTHQLNGQDVVSGYSFGWAVALSETTAVIGTFGGGRAPFTGGGVAYMFDVETGIEGSTLLPSEAVFAKRFGKAVALTGSIALVGDYRHSNTSTDSGAAFLLGPVPESYCTAGTSATGCRAAVTARGTASATVVSGFDLVAEGVPGMRNGIFFFGTSGRQANPWGDGSSFQCVVPPVVRGSLLSGHGTLGLCDNPLTLDLNARWCPTCPKPAQNPGAGAVVQAQLWYRDPQNTSDQTTSLSNAVEFTVAP